jgi:hypothetical protein
MGWLNSVVRLGTLASGAGPATGPPQQAARMEVAQQKQMEKQEAEPVEERVLKKLVRETELDPA